MGYRFLIHKICSRRTLHLYFLRFLPIDLRGGYPKCLVFSITSRINSSQSSKKPFPCLIAPIFAWVTLTSAAGRPFIATPNNGLRMFFDVFVLDLQFI